MWFGPDGHVTRVLRFPRTLGHANAGRWCDGGPPVFFGSLDDVGSKVLFVSSDGSPPRTLRFDGYAATLANVVGDEEREIVVRRRDGFAVYSAHGSLLRRVQASDYVWEFVALNTNASPTDELVAYLYQDRREGTFIELLDADGERIRAWHEATANQYSASAWSAPTPSLVAVLDDVVTERDVTGRVLRRFTVPGLGSYRRVATALLAGGVRLAVVSSGACPSRLLVFDPSGALVYDETFEAHAALLAPVHGGTEFLLGVGARIYRYKLESPGAVGA